jgi:cysteine desulfurase
MEHLKNLLENEQPKKVLVSLMHANNEIGNLLDIKQVGELCAQHHAIFHCDMVQTIGHYPINLQEHKVHFASAAGHKFHGPKGVGILYINAEVQVKPMILGGAQERNMRAGTENLYGIVGMAKALSIANEHFEEHSNYIKSLKEYMYQKLTSVVDGLVLNGDGMGNSLYTVLNISLPKNEKTEMILFNLDMAGICASGGSACSSGTTSISHVIKSIYPDAATEYVPIRFSFCKNNTKEEVDRVVDKIQELLA